MPAARALSSPSGEVAEDNVEEREKFWVGRNYGLLTDHGGWTDRRGIWNSILDDQILIKKYWIAQYCSNFIAIPVFFHLNTYWIWFGKPWVQASLRYYYQKYQVLYYYSKVSQLLWQGIKIHLLHGQVNQPLWSSKEKPAKCVTPSKLSVMEYQFN